MLSIYRDIVQGYYYNILFIMALGPITTYCIPSFFLMIGGEIAYSWILGDVKRIYRINDTINSLALGTVQQLFGAIIGPYIKAHYMELFKYRIFKNIPNNWISSIIIMIFADFSYYWAHRFGHKFNFMWAAHSIHHSSENFNYSTALRQAAFQSITNNWISLFPAALLGIPYNIYAFHKSLNTVMQFWIHTQYCKDLGPLEYIFNTPSQHIIHHDRSPGYCNKNFAGWFSIWDQLFGTFQLNHRPNKFGVIEQQYTWDPIIINLKNYYLLFKRMMKYKGIKPKIKWLFSSHRFVTNGGINDKNLSKSIRYNPLLTNNQNKYCIIIFGMTLFEYLYQILIVNKRENYKTQIITSFYLMLSLSSLCQFMNKSIIAKLTESLRLSLIVGLIAGSKYIDKKSNIYRFLTCNIGVIYINSKQNQYKSLLGIGIIGFAAWSLNSAIFDKKQDENHNFDDFINNHN